MSCMIAFISVSLWSEHEVCYPLYKIHKMTQQQILNKVLPPIRLVTSGTNGPTYRLEIFLENILNPVVSKYCENELVKDTAEFLRYIEMHGPTDMPTNIASL